MLLLTNPYPITGRRSEIRVQDLYNLPLEGDGVDEMEEQYRQGIQQLHQELVALKSEGILRDSLDISQRSKFELLEFLGR